MCSKTEFFKQAALLLRGVAQHPLIPAIGDRIEGVAQTGQDPPAQHVARETALGAPSGLASAKPKDTRAGATAAVGSTRTQPRSPR